MADPYGCPGKRKSVNQDVNAKQMLHDKEESRAAVFRGRWEVS